MFNSSPKAEYITKVICGFALLKEKCNQKTKN